MFEENFLVLKKSYEHGRLFVINRQDGTWYCDGYNDKQKEFLIRRADFTEEVKNLMKFQSGENLSNYDDVWPAIKIIARQILTWTEKPKGCGYNMRMDYSFLEMNKLTQVYDLRDYIDL